MRKLMACTLAIFLASFSFAKDSIDVYPSHWWVGMKNPKLQVMIHKKNIASQNFVLSPYNGVKLQKITKVENPNYVFLDLIIAPNTKPGKLQFKTYTDEGPNY